MGVRVLKHTYALDNYKCIFISEFYDRILTVSEGWARGIERRIMKLAEALQERADLNKKIEELRRRLVNNSLVQEGEAPAEEPSKLKLEIDACIKSLAYLIGRINYTNCKTFIGEETLTELIAKKDVMYLQLSVYRDAVDRASHISDRARMSEIKIKSAFSVKDLQKQIDELSADLRKLENKLQEKNWTVELIEEIIKD